MTVRSQVQYHAVTYYLLWAAPKSPSKAGLIIHAGENKQKIHYPKTNKRDQSQDQETHNLENKAQTWQ